LLWGAFEHWAAWKRTVERLKNQRRCFFLGTESERKGHKRSSSLMLIVMLLAGTVVTAVGIVWLVESTQPIWWGILLLLSGVAVLCQAVYALFRRNMR
jgi:biotin transporter BioY